MNKRDLRLHIRNEFQVKETAHLAERSQNIYKYLFAWDGWTAARKIGITMSTANEINTIPIMKRGWEEEKEIAVPKVAPREHQLHFYTITSFSQTKAEFKGIREPDPSQTVKIEPSELDLMIVPGLAFDVKKYRLGFGGGFYDRLLSSVSVSTCGLALDFQVFEHLPKEPHDIPLDVLITEHGII